MATTTPNTNPSTSAGQTSPDLRRYRPGEYLQELGSNIAGLGRRAVDAVRERHVRNNGVESAQSDANRVINEEFLGLPADIALLETYGSAKIGNHTYDEDGDAIDYVAELARLTKAETGDHYTKKEWESAARKVIREKFAYVDEDNAAIKLEAHARAELLRAVSNFNELIMPGSDEEMNDFIVKLDHYLDNNNTATDSETDSKVSMRARVVGATSSYWLRGREKVGLGPETARGRKVAAALGVIALGGIAAWGIYKTMKGIGGGNMPSFMQGMDQDGFSDLVDARADAKVEAAKSQAIQEFMDKHGISNEDLSKLAMLDGEGPQSTSPDTLLSSVSDAQLQEKFGEAHKIGSGEGWFSTFNQLGITDADDQRALLADKDLMQALEKDGYAYRAPELGGWGLNMTPDHQIDGDALRTILDHAHENGIDLDLSGLEIDVSATDSSQVSQQAAPVESTSNDSTTVVDAPAAESEALPTNNQPQNIQDTVWYQSTLDSLGASTSDSAVQAAPIDANKNFVELPFTTETAMQSIKSGHIEGLNRLEAPIARDLALQIKDAVYTGSDQSVVTYDMFKGRWIFHEAPKGATMPSGIVAKMSDYFENYRWLKLS